MTLEERAQEIVSRFIDHPVLTREDDRVDDVWQPTAGVETTAQGSTGLLDQEVIQTFVPRPGSWEQVHVFADMNQAEGTFEYRWFRNDQLIGSFFLPAGTTGGRSKPIGTPIRSGDRLQHLHTALRFDGATTFGTLRSAHEMSYG